MGVFTVLLVAGAALALVPGLPVIQLLVAIQVLNGILLPVIVLFILLLANDRRVAQDLRNGRLANGLGWATFAIVSVAALALLGSQAAQILGVSLFGA